MKTECEFKHPCCCGTATHTPHEVGKDGCKRFMTEAPELIPPDNRQGFNQWTVDGHPVSDYTLRFQRGYSQISCGCWSRWEGSVNSLPDET